MEKVVLMTSFCLLFLLGCNAEDSPFDQNFDPPEVGSQDAISPYPVSEAERIAAIDELLVLRKELKVLEGHLIAPATEDHEAYANFLGQENTGIFRIFPGNSGNEKRPLLIRGEGSYYQFKNQTHEYGYGSDISFTTMQEPMFGVGFAGVDYGFFAQLGKVDIQDVDLASDTIAFALDYKSPNGQLEPKWRREQNRWSMGQTHKGVLFRDRTKATVGMSYVLRSVSQGSYDVAVLFQVVRRDNTDGSLVIVWRMLEEFETPILKRNF